MTLFFNREAEKSRVIREHRVLIVDLHQYVAWIIHTEAEAGKRGGRMPVLRLKQILREYLAREGHDSNLVDSFFTGMVERVGALVERVLGTYEFEVQPLREYFAAKYLYETAPYSPPGREKKGTKPERFAAISRNSYWLNVTRFYCGLFSRGELGSLSEEFDELGGSDEFKLVAHPRVLAMMLLGDWVFTQQPSAVRRVVSSLVTHPGFKVFLARMYRRDTEDNIKLAPGCGRDELLDVCRRELSRATSSDWEVAIARLMRANASPEDIMAYWESLEPHRSKFTPDWLRKGSALQVFEALHCAKLLSIWERDADGVLSYILLADRHDFLESSDVVFGKALNLLLDGRGEGWFRGADENRPLARLAWALNPHLYSSAFEGVSYSVFATLGKWGVAYLGVQIDRESKLEFPDCLSPTETRQLGDFLIVAESLSETPTSTWTSSLEPWSELIEAGRTIWGERWALRKLALCAALVQTRQRISPAAQNLFDTNVPLCERVLYAKRHSQSERWWVSQLSSTSSVDDVKFVLAMLFAWAPPNVLSGLFEHISGLVNDLGTEDWEGLLSTRSVFFHRSPPRRKLSRDFFTSLKKTVPRIWAACATIGRFDNEKLFTNVLRHYKGSDRAVLDACMEMALELAARGRNTWEELLYFGKRNQATEAQMMFSGSWQFRNPNFAKPSIDIAKKVCGSPDEYPVAIVAHAERVLAESLGARAARVATIARRDKWFQ